jgi:ATP-dependent DNA helicase PIF1
LDYIDELLRNVHITNKPFGGIQVVLIGDFFQLPPTTGEFSRRYLNRKKPIYRSAYFFDSKVFMKASFKFHELTKVYRQTDVRFEHILNKIHAGNVNDETLLYLNKRVITD